MKALIYILGWGSPIGIGLFILLLSISAGIIIKSISKAELLSRK